MFLMVSILVKCIFHLALFEAMQVGPNSNDYRQNRFSVLNLSSDLRTRNHYNRLHVLGRSNTIIFEIDLTRVRKIVQDVTREKK